MIAFGNGRPLKEVLPALIDDERRHQLILEVVERNSVIEGLPPMSEEVRSQILNNLRRLSSGADHTAAATPAE
ncbi:hypothetical protein Pan189_27780 [Stratiformator vulcanicus]|uniref:Uncharacterized protein n=1 Tax=Stratiformator vulcanicus TaxID=2527980 RepID=A0A517R3C1_9PLAN|nr:hypothetical protein Pan189_27780 [Stratiformator vulcanicus]